MTAAHAIKRAWLSTGGTGAKNYDEFADETQTTRIIEANPTSMLAVEMPDRTPEAVASGLDFEACLPAASERLSALQESGRFAPAENLVAAYRITDADGGVASGMFCMIDTDEISAEVEEPGRVIRNEDVFVEKVRQRAALNDRLQHLLSPVLLVAKDSEGALDTALQEAFVGDPVVCDVDEADRRHEIWAVPPGPLQDRLCRLAGGDQLIVADGNHRSLAAQVGQLPQFLAVVTTAASVTISPYHRLVHELPIDASELVEALRRRGAEVEEVAGPPATPPAAGTVLLYAEQKLHAVRFPEVDGSIVDRLDHARVEAVLFNQLLGWDAGDKRITYVGGDYPPSWLAEQVDSGAADVAVLIAPVGVDDFVDVNLARLKLPRKSTWFTPKARAGLVLADLR